MKALYKDSQWLNGNDVTGSGSITCVHSTWGAPKHKEHMFEIRLSSCSDICDFSISGDKKGCLEDLNSYKSQIKIMIEEISALRNATEAFLKKRFKKDEVIEEKQYTSRRWLKEGAGAVNLASISCIVFRSSYTKEASAYIRICDGSKLITLHSSHEDHLNTNNKRMKALVVKLELLEKSLTDFLTYIESVKF